MNVLHREVVAALAFADVQDLGDVHVRELTCDPSLFQELGCELLVLCDGLAQPLDDHELLDTSRRSL